VWVREPPADAALAVALALQACQGGALTEAEAIKRCTTPRATSFDPATVFAVLRGIGLLHDPQGAAAQAPHEPAWADKGLGFAAQAVARAAALRPDLFAAPDPTPPAAAPPASAADAAESKAGAAADGEEAKESSTAEQPPAEDPMACDAAPAEEPPKLTDPSPPHMPAALPAALPPPLFPPGMPPGISLRGAR